MLLHSWCSRLVLKSVCHFSFSFYEEGMGSFKHCGLYSALNRYDTAQSFCHLSNHKSDAKVCSAHLQNRKVQRWWQAKKKEILCITLRGMEKDSRKLEKGGKMRIEWYDSWWCRPGTLCSALKMIILSRWEAIAAVCHLQNTILTIWRISPQDVLRMSDIINLLGSELFYQKAMLS